MHEKDLQIYYGWSCLPCQNEDGTVAHNEALVGRVLKPHRNHVVIASKFGVQHDADSSPTTIRKAIEGSLNRLNTDHLDLYYQQSARLQNAGGGGS